MYSVEDFIKALNVVKPRSLECHSTCALAGNSKFKIGMGSLNQRCNNVCSTCPLYLNKEEAFAYDFNKYLVLGDLQRATSILEGYLCKGRCANCPFRLNEEQQCPFRTLKKEAEASFSNYTSDYINRVITYIISLANKDSNK